MTDTDSYPSDAVLAALAEVVPDFSESPVQLQEVLVVTVFGKAVAVDRQEFDAMCLDFQQWNEGVKARAAKVARRTGK